MFDCYDKSHVKYERCYRLILVLMSFSYQVKYSSKRKTVAIKIENSCVKVYAPNYISPKQIEEFVDLKSGWIMDKLSFQSNTLVKSILEQRQIAVLGQVYELCFCDGATSTLSESNNLIIVTTNRKVKCKRTVALKQLTAYLKLTLTEHLEKRLELLSEQIGVTYESIKVRQYKRRWGSCDKQGRLTFNVQLALAPTEIIDYVLVHELCHRVYLNHSREFWQLVEAYSPLYRDSEKWLKENGLSLDILKL